MRINIQPFRSDIAYFLVILVLSFEVRVTMLFTEDILLQAAIVLVEVVFFVLKIVGIKVPASHETKKEIAVSVLECIRACQQTQKAIEDFTSSWNGAEGVSQKQAWSIWGLLKEMSSSILWIIFKASIKGMSKRDWFKAIAVFSATIIASSVSTGSATVILMALALNSAVDLFREIRILMTLLRV